MIVAIWVIAAILLGLWSLSAWALHVLATLGSGWAGDAAPHLDEIPFAELLDAWAPGWQSLVQLALEVTQGLLGWIGGAEPLLLWLVWGAGAVLLTGAAGLLTLAVLLIRRTTPGAPPAPPAAAA